MSPTELRKWLAEEVPVRREDLRTLHSLAERGIAAEDQFKGFKPVGRERGEDRKLRRAIERGTVEELRSEVAVPDLEEPGGSSPD